MPELSPREALSHRIPRTDIEIHLGRCRREARLPYLSGLCLSSHLHCEKALSERGTGDRSGLFSLCLRFDDYRSVPFPFPLGTFPQNQSCHQDAHLPRSAGIDSDQSIILTSKKSRASYPETLRRVSYVDLEKNKRYVYLTNIFTVPAKTVADIYKQRWQVELFFRWIKQHLRIKTFYGTSPN